MKTTNKLVMATNNANKLREAREILSPLGIEVLSQREAGADCDPDENGSTFAENAIIKATAVYEAVGLPTIADDSGLCVDALGGRPGVHSARYAPKGQECDKLLGEMKDVPDGERGAAFRCTICYIDENGHTEFTGSCEGSIGYEQRGSNGFGYDPVFMVGDRTMAELSADEKNSISHRGAALRELYRFLRERNGE
ncbi:MAG: RdgB/HAM1 family non-canonical purine NTP pyrophosphatase [Ruminococcus sp.]|nr:RdgB/HAM1 family non-canonical purine NTP pyrophosphatase [Ruminococcus sp.]